MNEERNDMDAFKELMTRAPDMELMNIDELHGMVFWSGAAVTWAQTNISLAKELGGLTAQIDAWLAEGNAAAEFNFQARAKRGELAREEKSTPAGGQPSSSSPKAPVRDGTVQPKWQRLGYKSEVAMQDDQFLANNPEVVEKVKQQAKEAGDFPSVTAVKSEKRAQRAEERFRESRAQVNESPDINEAALSVVAKLDECHAKLIALYKHKNHLSDYNLKAIEYAAEKIYNITKGE